MNEDVPVGWVYWLGDHWHLCADEPVAHPRRQPVYLASHVTRLRGRITEQGRQLTQKDAALREKNLLLDALHLVWCSGGCPNGVHRYGGGPVTEDLVVRVERQALRLRRWWNSALFRLDHGTGWENLAEKVEKPDGVGIPDERSVRG